MQCSLSLLAFIDVNNDNKSTIKASQKKKDKKKKKDIEVLSFPDEPHQNTETAVNDSPSKAPLEVTAEELADEEWGPVKDKKKNKKDKKDKGGKREETQEQSSYYAAITPRLILTITVGTPAEEAKPATPADQNDDANEEADAPKILSKKEKEKLKKEKEKARNMAILLYSTEKSYAVVPCTGEKESSGRREEGWRRHRRARGNGSYSTH